MPLPSRGPNKQCRVVSNDGEVPALETVLSIAMLGAFIWAVGFLLPRAIKEHDALALACAVLFAVLALFAWLLSGTGTRSMIF
jgi:hypothetical protein